MQLIRHQLHLIFEDPPRPWGDLRSLLRVASDDPSAELKAAPMIIERESDKTQVVIQVRAAIVAKETEGIDLPQAARDAQAEMMRLCEVAPFPAVSLMQYDAHLIQAVDMPFHALVDDMKARFLVPTRVANLSTDIGLVYDQRDGTLLRRVNIGPMDKAQLLGESLKWPREDVPETFVFATLRCEARETRDFSPEMLTEFLSASSEWQGAEAEALTREFTGGR